MKAATEISRKALIERWENCLRVLQSLTPHQRRKHWDMSKWGEVTDCGTVACAAGHCALDPWFQRRGLKMTFVQKIDEWGEEHTDVKFDEDLVPVFFGETGTLQIFYDTNRRTVSAVIKEIKDYIKRLKTASGDSCELAL